MSLPNTSKNLQLDIKRHSVAHLMASAIKEMFPEVQFGVGPVIENGCYYDFILPRTLIPEDLSLIELKMKNFLKRDLAYKVQQLSLQEAIILFESQSQTLKVELLNDLATRGTTNMSEEEKGDFDPTNELKITVYRIVDQQTGEILFEDLCKGPHIEMLKELKSIGFKLDKFSGSYWRGDQARNIQMQRIYALVFDLPEELEKFLIDREEAKKRDHRLLGQQMEIYTISEDVGAGLPIYLPNGATIRQLLEKYCYQEAKKSGYQYVYTPHIGKSDLFAKSGHLEHYADGMYAPIDMVNLKGDGVLESGKTEKFYLKPMNCPMHHQVYLNKPRSYKELPYKLYEYGTVYRYEESGTLAGMIRVRGFTQNDAHVYCQTSQLKEVIEEALNRMIKTYKDVGIGEYKIRFSLPDFVNEKEKFGEETEEWRNSVSAMKQSLDELGVEYYEAIGEAAFYGPKIDIQVKNVNGKEDSLSTIQVDYSIAPKFGITFTNSHGQDEVPAIIHMALMGSVDRFMAFMLEMTAGRLPFWLAPEQIKILTVNNQENITNYVDKTKKALDDIVLMKPLKFNELRYAVDDRNESLGKKIREAEKRKIPVIIIIGPKDIENNQISVRTQKGEEKINFEDLSNFLITI
jgi:threonyl-tRNA synthetase